MANFILHSNDSLYLFVVAEKRTSDYTVLKEALYVRPHVALAYRSITLKLESVKTFIWDAVGGGGLGVCTLAHLSATILYPRLTPRYLIKIRTRSGIICRFIRDLSGQPTKGLENPPGGHSMTTPRKQNIPGDERPPWTITSKTKEQESKLRWEGRRSAGWLVVLSRKPLTNHPAHLLAYLSLFRYDNRLSSIFVNGFLTGWRFTNV